MNYTYVCWIEGDGSSGSDVATEVLWGDKRVRDVTHSGDYEPGWKEEKLGKRNCQGQCVHTQLELICLLTSSS